MHSWCSQHREHKPTVRLLTGCSGNPSELTLPKRLYTFVQGPEVVRGHPNRLKPGSLKVFGHEHLASCIHACSRAWLCVQGCGLADPSQWRDYSQPGLEDTCGCRLQRPSPHGVLAGLEQASECNTSNTLPQERKGQLCPPHQLSSQFSR